MMETAFDIDKLFERQYWIQALTLEERIGAVEEWEHYPIQKSKLKVMQAWLDNPVFNDEYKTLDWRLEQFNINKKKLSNIVLGQAKYNLKAVDFGWLDFIELSYKQHWLAPKNSAINISETPFSIIARPVIVKSIFVLEKKIKAIAPDKNLTFFNRMLELLPDGLLKRIENCVAKTMVFELHLAKKAGFLTEETPEKRFLEYIGMYESKVCCLEVLNSYPVMARLIVNICHQWIESSFEMVHRLYLDKEAIHHCYGLDVNSLISIEVAKGDYHNGGRSVASVSFEGAKSIVYKPRSLLSDVLFEELLTWFNQYSTFDLQHLKVLDKGDYGWAEFIGHEACSSEKELIEFYYNYGVLAVIAYIFQITDLHLENIIAKRNMPIIIDMESLLHPLTDDKLVEEYSIGRSLLFPSIKDSDDSSEEYIMRGSGLDKGEGELFRFECERWQKRNTDEMFSDFGEVEYSKGKNQPYINENKKVDYTEYFKFIIRGFQDAYLCVYNNKESFISSSDWLQKALGSERRYLPKSTSQYATCLRESLHPKCLTDDLARQSVIESLASFRKTNILNLYLLDRERQCIRDLNIPYFSSKAVESVEKVDTQCHIRERILLMSETKLKKIVEQMDTIYLHLKGDIGTQP